MHQAIVYSRAINSTISLKIITNYARESALSANLSTYQYQLYTNDR